jgi:glyoxylase I family protein
MAIELTKDSIDLGIIVSDGGKALAFYRDTLGMEPEGDMPMPGGGTMHRLKCGTSTIKVIEPGKQLEAKAPGGGIQGAYGYRYWTISVADLDGITRKCGDAGYKVVVPVTALRPGIRISIVEDPDGNWVEFLESK